MTKFNSDLLHEHIKLEQAEAFEKMFWELTNKANYFGYARRHLRGLRLMVDLGWFVWPSADGALGNQLWIAHTDNKVSREVISAWLEQAVADDAEDIFSVAIEVWPARQRFLESARNRYAAEDWPAFLPLILAQVDGMSKEIFRKKSQLFYDGAQKKRRATQRKWRKQYFSKHQALFYVAQYGEKTRWHEPRVGDTRHDILHGISVDYDTRFNALQAMSLLGFMCLLKDMLQNVKSEASGADSIIL